MEDDEDWDTPPKTNTKPSKPNNDSTSHQTLKITDGYKYSYEALSSPANIDDWIETPSYAGSKSTFGAYSQNSFGDNNRSFRNEKNSGNKSFNSIKNSNNFPSKASPRNFNTPRSNRYSNKIPNVVQMNDWDTLTNSSNQTSGSWKGNANIPVNITTEEDWDDATESMPQNKKSFPNATEIPMYNQNNSKQNMSNGNVIEDEDWDTPTGITDKNNTTNIESQSIPTLDSNSSIHSSNNNMDENWNTDPSEQSTSNTSRNGFIKDIPLYNPNNSNEQSYSNPFNQRYENNYHINKHPHSRNFESNDRYSRDSFSRHSRGNRHSPYERVSRGRGSRGGRGGRGGRNNRDGSYHSFYSRDSSRNSGDRKDNLYQHHSYTKNRNSDKTYQSPPINSFKNSVDESEDWESPSGFVDKNVESNTLPITVTPPPEQVEESWD